MTTRSQAALRQVRDEITAVDRVAEHPGWTLIQTRPFVAKHQRNPQDASYSSYWSLGPLLRDIEIRNARAANRKNRTTPATVTEAEASDETGTTE